VSKNRGFPEDGVFFGNPLFLRILVVCIFEKGNLNPGFAAAGSCAGILKFFHRPVEKFTENSY